MPELVVPDWIRPRSDWGARPTDPHRPLTFDRLPWPRLWAHHTAGSMWATPADIQYLHQIINGWRDAAYNFYIRILRGGGVEVGELLPLGARHLNSDAGHSGTIVWVGNFDATPVPEPMIDAGARLVAHGVLAGWWSDELADEPHLTGGHRDIPGARPTACPGRHLHGALPVINGRAAQIIHTLRHPEEAPMELLYDTRTWQCWVHFGGGVVTPADANKVHPFWAAHAKAPADGVWTGRIVARPDMARLVAAREVAA